MHEKWDEYWLRGWGIDPELARERLDFLKHEQERAMFNPFDANWNAVDRNDEPLFYTNQQHAFNRSCQCKRCVKMHTITMQDRELLRTMGIAWTEAPHAHESTNASRGQSTLATPKA